MFGKFKKLSKTWPMTGRGIRNINSMWTGTRSILLRTKALDNRVPGKIVT